MYRTILVADAATDTREEMSWCLRAAGYRVLTAEDGFDAMAELSKGPVSLLVLALPHPDGSAVLRLLVTDPRFAKTSVLIVTDTPERAPPQLAVLKRPFSDYRLVEIVRSMVGTPRRRLSTTPLPPSAVAELQSADAHADGLDDGES